MDNGPGQDPGNIGLPDGVSYCADCGIIMVYGYHRECPGCHLDDRVNALEARIEELEGDDDGA